MYAYIGEKDVFSLFSHLYSILMCAFDVTADNMAGFAVLLFYHALIAALSKLVGICSVYLTSRQGSFSLCWCHFWGRLG
jgi:hypothetical protein